MQMLTTHKSTLLALLELIRFLGDDDPFELVAHQLPHATSECDAAHGVQQEIYTEIGVVEEHGELLETPEELGQIFLP